MKKTIQAWILMDLCTAAMAAAPTSDDIRRCGAIADSTARLACFDKLSGSTPPSAPATNAPAAVPAAATLGAETLPKTREEKAADTAPTSLTAVVAGVLATQGNMYRITLDNGQVWQTQEGRSVFLVKVGDTVRIDKRSMGGYQIAKFVDGKAGYPVRAIRQK